MTLYAKWLADTYTVTFKDYDGTVLKTENVINGSPATAPATPTRTGYTFAAWDKAFTAVTSHMTVTATYTVRTYTVTFTDWNDAVLKTETGVAYQTGATAPLNPTRDGYTFAGWDKTFNSITADTTVKATYTANLYTVTFHSMGGTAVVSITNAARDALLTAPAAPTRTGFAFDGWYQDYALTDAWNFAVDTVAANMTLYTKWNADAYAITVNADIAGGVDQYRQPRKRVIP